MGSTSAGGPSTGLNFRHAESSVTPIPAIPAPIASRRDMEYVPGFTSSSEVGVPFQYPRLAYHVTPLPLPANPAIVMHGTKGRIARARRHATIIAERGLK